MYFMIYLFLHYESSKLHVKSHSDDGGGGGETGSDCEHVSDRNGPKQASPEQDDSPFLRGNMSLCVLFVLVGWFVCSEVVSRHCRGKSVTSVRLRQRETVTHRHSITFTSNASFTSSCQLFRSGFPCKLVHVCCFTNIPMHVYFNDCVNWIHTLLFSSGPWMEVWDAREVSVRYFIECCGFIWAFVDWCICLNDTYISVLIRWSCTHTFRLYVPLRNMC